MTTATTTREAEAEAWLAVVSHRLGEQSGALMDTAEALADRADAHGQVDPAPPVEQIAVWAGRPRTACRRAVSVLVDAGLLTPDNLGALWLTVPGLGHTTDHATTRSS